jgi:outer membrane protein assembly factor BamB
VLVTAMAEGERDFVVALDAASGAEIWRYDLAPTYAGHDGSHDGPISTPAIAGGRVFMLSPWGHVAAIDFESGQELWTRHLVDDLESAKPLYGFGSSPAVAGGVMALQIGGAEGAVAGFDVATGEIKWRSVGEDPEIGAQSPIVAEIAGREQFLVLGSKQLVGLAPEDGATLWTLPLEGEAGGMGAWTQSPLPLDDRRIFIKHQQGQTAVVEVSEGEDGLSAAVVSESRGLARSYSPAALGGERVFGFTARFLSAVDPESGELLWRSREPGDGFLVTVGDQLAVLTKTGELHLGAASPESWQETSSLQLFDDLAWTPPSFANGSLYLRSLGEIARVDLTRLDRPRVAASSDSTPPPALVSLAESADPSAAIDRFVGEHELPLIEGDEVVFVWHGKADDVAIGGDMIGMRREEPMNRLAGTDLWWWRTELDPRARMSYLFFVDYEPRTDPSHDRVVTTTVLGPDMNWQREEPVEMSWFAMPGWPGLSAEPDALAAGAGGRLETVEITVQPPTPDDGEAPEPVSVTTHVWLPPGYDQGDDRYPVVYVHNRHARERGGWPETLDRVVGRSVAPLIVVFPEPPRMRGFGDLFVEQVVPEIDRRYRTKAERDSRANVGMGWPGMSASRLTLANSELFGVLGVQSMYLLEEQMNAVKEAAAEIDAASTPMRIYLEWGRWDLISPHEEMNMRQSSRWAWDFFTERGWQPIGGEVWDSTDFASWRNRTGVMLEALFPAMEGANSLESWQTEARTGGQSDEASGR